MSVFLSAFSAIRQDAETVVSQLEERGFTEFLSHPLLLTLACIVRTTSTTAQPRSALRLLERALDVLCVAWDEQKNIDRQRTTPLDGHDPHGERDGFGTYLLRGVPRQPFGGKG